VEIRPWPHDKRYGVTRDGRVFRLVPVGRWPAGETTQYLGKRGYFLTCVAGKVRPVHRLVAETYIPNPLNKPEVAHNNGTRTDNRDANLRWATRQENADDMPGHGTLMFGNDHVTRKLSLDEVRQIQVLVVGKPPGRRPYHREVAEQYGVTRECITRIANGDRWIRATAS
jgi:hypothetical protein